jgi:hypothetical protein
MLHKCLEAIQSVSRKLLHSGTPQKVHFGEPGPSGDLPKAALPIQLSPGAFISATCGPDQSFSDLVTSPVPHASLESTHDSVAIPAQSHPFDSLSWDHASQHLSGSSVSLYDANPVTGQHNGDPIADCFGAVQYDDGAILACADGVNWGTKPKLAARCAVYASLRSLHTALSKHPVGDSTRMFSLMLHAVNRAQEAILHREGTLTTLVLTVVARCPSLKVPPCLTAPLLITSAPVLYRPCTCHIIVTSCPACTERVK